MGLLDDLVDPSDEVGNAVLGLLHVDEVKAGLLAQGWLLVHSRVLDADVIWYRTGWAHAIPRAMSEGRVCYRDDEIALLATQQLTAEQLRALHLVKQVFYRALVVAELPEAEPLERVTEHVSIVWESSHAG